MPIFPWTASGADAPLMLITLLMFTHTSPGASRQKITVQTYIHKVINPIRLELDISFQVLNLFCLENSPCLLVTHLLVWSLFVVESPNQKRKWNMGENFILLYFLPPKSAHYSWSKWNSLKIVRKNCINSNQYLLDKCKWRSRWTIILNCEPIKT